MTPPARCRSLTMAILLAALLGSTIGGTNAYAIGLPRVPKLISRRTQNVIKTVASAALIALISHGSAPTGPLWRITRLAPLAPVSVTTAAEGTTPLGSMTVTFQNLSSQTVGLPVDQDNLATATITNSGGGGAHARVRLRGGSRASDRRIIRIAPGNQIEAAVGLNSLELPIEPVFTISLPGASQVTAYVPSGVMAGAIHSLNGADQQLFER